MTTKINSDTSDGLKITSDTSGVLDIQSAGTTKMTVGSTIDIQGNELVLDADADTSIHASTDDQIDFKIGGTDKVKIDSSGRVLINCTNYNNEILQIDGGTQTALRLDNDGTSLFSLINFSNANGIVGTIKTTGSSTQYNTSSDYRLKENVSYTFDATTRLKQLKPARFNFKADADTTVDGFIAHEVSSIVPEAISGEKDGDAMQGIDQSKLVPLLVKTIQELEARITALES